ncbi:hypothetical protein ACGFJT_31275 [Actinomadura geliboluensis]|uniref:hypothetical protein n=1 Tax=Actinomadura geliboluensis TaxID=882440 RepID=UPI00370FBE1A
MTQPPAEVPVPPQGPRPYDRQRYEELTQRLGMALLQVAPAGWRRIDLRILMLAGVTDLRLSVIMPDGSSPAADPPRDCAQIAAELRSMMYRTGEGTWFGMRFMMDPPSAYWVSFNADFDPGWDPPAAPEEWARDLALFPRDDEHVPGWLRERLDRTAGAHGG